MDVDPSIPDQRVRITDNPGRTGVTTGRIKNVGSINMAEVDFGPNDLEFKPVDGLELVDQRDDVISLFDRGVFASPADLRRLLTYHKLRGELTNVFYSMEASNTDFYPHQFKPVLTFVQSTLGRMLIADEVGLGKTIEAILIWLELQAREDARRLLVICPSMLREKWQRDLKEKFNIDARIVAAQELVSEARLVTDGNYRRSFSLISSLEGVRPPRDYDDPKKTTPRAVLARLLEENPTVGELALFDLTIIDEAHYLRNPETASHTFGEIVRSCSRNFLLLTATPIQLKSDNLFQILRLIDPDYFQFLVLFEALLSANAPVVKALRALWSVPPAIEDAIDALRDALGSAAFSSDRVLRSALNSLELSDDCIAPDARVELARMVETRSLFSRYMVRSRKRDVLEGRVIRDSQTVSVTLNEQEHEIYESVTKNIREMSRDMGELGTFRLIARQRQLASCIPAAIKTWNDKELLEEYLDEYLWEDLGIGGEMYAAAEEAATGTYGAVSPTIPDLGTYDELVRNDTKYAKFIEVVRRHVTEGEKVVVFAFFRATLSYLNERLESDNVESIVLMGGMGPRKIEVIEVFRQVDGPSVLLSSELGSEGIDLQFCRVMINYDLPWNPMRVEQRIGRIDRLGQTAEKISIVNLSLENTIEDRILHRLYERIRIFQDSIGDLEEILGEVTHEIIRTLLDPDLSDEQREKSALQTENALVNRRKEQDQLEKQAVNLIGFTDYLLDSINQGRERRRWISASDLADYVQDFFGQRYPGSVLELSKDASSTGKIDLSPDACSSLDRFVRERKPVVETSLFRTGSNHAVTFDPKGNRQNSQRGRVQPEVICARHPLIGWITDHYTRGEFVFHPVFAAILPAASSPIAPADYVMVVQKWSIHGLRNRVELAYQCVDVAAHRALSGDDSETLSAAVCGFGQPFENAANLVGNIADVTDCVSICEENLDERFSDSLEHITLENEALCDQEENAAKTTANRRIAELNERIGRFDTDGRGHLVPMTKGLIRKEESILAEKIRKVDTRRNIDPGVSNIATILVRVR